ncbi:hypothetical protein ACFFGV_18250 [Pontibacillus salicampi]|uniref:Pectate lyase superfamily protein domain-containing protein n=1 Tax=Pontibacillus salicampi TaxID=1449801 RepID=A0ABV6LT61_9BACI
MNKKWIYVGTIATLTFLIVVLIAYLNASSLEEKSSILVEEFGGYGNDDKDDSSAIQDAIDLSYKENKLPVQLLGETYILKQGLQLKEGVSLVMGQSTKLLVEGNFNVLELKKNTSITKGTIEVTNPDFSSNVVYISGEEKIWTTESIIVEQLTLYNSSGSNSGNAISFIAEGSGEFISFVNVVNVNISGFHTSVYLQAIPPNNEEEYNFINGNRFINVTMEDCIVCIHMNSEVTIPNEVSGNVFDNLQIQLTERTERVAIISGSHNTIEGMIWDASILKDSSPLIDFQQESYKNVVETNLSNNRIVDVGKENRYGISISD